MNPLRILAVAICFCGLAATAEARPFVIGSISHKPGDENALFIALANHLGRHLSEFGFDSGKVVVAADIPGLIALFNAGTVDLYFDSPHPTLAVSHGTGSKIVLRRWKKGKAEYRSVIVVRKDSAVRSLADLLGRLIAFESDFSTSGYLLPKIAIEHAGLTLREQRAAGNAIAPDEIGFVFSNDEENTLLWVLRGRVVAGAVGIHDLERFRPKERDQLRIIHETVTVPRQLVSVRKDASEPLIASIRGFLIGLDHSEAGQALMMNLENTTRFDDVPAGLVKSLETIRAQLARASHPAKR
ncbi:MAG: phosphate/phosphite/phosphonate ABC transporter substrate-binding protein [Burkholderiales bacterium]